jgi:hypothetical protein
LARGIWPALKNIPNINRIAGQPHGLDDLGQQLARLPNERFALLILIGTRRFPNEHQLRIQAAYAKYDIPARRGQVRALHTCHRPLPQLRECGRLGLRTKHDRRRSDCFLARQRQAERLFNGRFRLCGLGRDRCRP